MLGSAILHSSIGLYTKSSGDTLAFRCVLMLGAAVVFSPLLFLHPFPSAETWRFLLIGAGLHWAFQMAMISAFDRGDMGLVYPVMRGSAPLLAGFFALLFLQERLNLIEWSGLALASAAALAFAWPDKGGAPKLKALAFALIAALMTALYSVNDAAGARSAGSGLAYVGWFFLVTTPGILATGLVRRGRALPGLMRKELRIGLIAAVFGGLSYLLALTAFALAPVAPMAAMRETSIVFGAILAALVLKENFGRRRIVLAILLAAGLVMIQAF